MTRILLIRHGSTDLLGRVLYGRMPGVHLNEDGRRHAELLGHALQERYEIDEVISSPMERALETARFIADASGANVTIDERINEIDVGLWIGKPFSELATMEEWKRYNRNRSTISPPGGESMVQVQIRGWNALRAIEERHRHRDSTVALVTHGDVIRGLLILLLGMPLDHIHRIEVAPVSVTEVLIGDGPPRVLRINQIF
jgi:probable phosphoglycerate mutase